MDEQDIFIRPAIPVTEDPVVQIPLDNTFCRFCGLTLDAHPEKQDEPEISLEDRIEDVIYDPPPRRPILCPESFHIPSVSRIPVLDAQATLAAGVPPPSILRHDSSNASTNIADMVQFSNDLLQWTDPAVVRYVQSLTASFHLKCFDALSFRRDETAFSTELSEDGVAGETTAPYTLLAQCLRVVVKELVNGGVEAAKTVAEHVRNRRRTELVAQAFAAGDPFPSIPDKALKQSAKQVLTPSHVLKGLSGPSHHSSLLQLAVRTKNVNGGGSL